MPSVNTEMTQDQASASTESRPVSHTPQRDRDYFLAHRDSLMKSYAGKYVAIRDRQVVASAATRRRLQHLLNERFGEGTYAFVRRVSKDAFESDTGENIVVS